MKERSLRDIMEVKVVELMCLALLSAGSADLFCRCSVINIPPSLLINDPLRYFRVVTLMTQRCSLKNRAAVRAKTDSCLAMNHT